MLVVSLLAGGRSDGDAYEPSTGGGRDGGNVEFCGDCWLETWLDSCCDGGVA